MEWSIRNLLNPVITRLLIYGVNPIDVEYVVSTVETTKHLNARSLERSWLDEWEKKAKHYADLGTRAAYAGSDISASEFFFLAAQCYYAVFLVNFAGIEEKKRVYALYADFYEKSMSFSNAKVERFDIPLPGDSSLPGYLHLPTDTAGKSNACIIVFSGLGSSKEEMHMLARPLAARGITAFVPDMPGNGEALFSRNIKCRYKTLESAFKAIPETLAKKPGLEKAKFGVYGLCMGGGYAHRAASSNPIYSLCVTLFPLFITSVGADATPQWMRQGDWYEYQTGGIAPSDFLGEMRGLENGSLSCPFFFIHGEHDNWMTIEKAEKLFDNARGEKEKLIVTSEPVFSSGEKATHTMPVGEQLHWIRHVAADWILAHCK
jgi:dienelactone hydrolase